MSKRFNLKRKACLLGIICGSVFFFSCSNSDDISGGGPTSGKQLSLTINTTPISRASGDDASGAQEVFNRLTVGIFSSDGGTVRTIQELTSGTGTGTFSVGSDGTATANILTAGLQEGDKITVAVNAPAGLFSGVQSMAAFNAKTIGIDQALATSSDGTVSKDKEVTDNIPMYGDGTLSYDQTKSVYTSTVDVQHQVAKITVSTVKVDFDQSGPYSSATFQPTAFFLINVPNDLAFSDAAWTGTTSDLNQGWKDGVTDKTYYAYLGTGDLGTTYPALKYSTNTTENSITPNQFFYTMPNSDATNNTKLVIEGKFSADGSTTTSLVYYPVNINWIFDNPDAPDGGTLKTVSPNKNYNCSVTIKTKGSPDPYTPLDPEDVTVNVTVTAFKSVNQNAVFP